MNQTNLKDKFKGTIVGAVAGDALGMPTEYISQSTLNKHYGGKVTQYQNPHRDHPNAHLFAGQYTDDGQQIIASAKSLIKQNGFNIKDFAKSLGEWGHKCDTIPGYDRYSGGTSLLSTLKLYNGTDPSKSGGHSPTCGAAMRIAPIALFYHSDENLLTKYTTESTTMTHTNKDAIESALIISHTVRNLLTGKNPLESILEARTHINGKLTENIDYVIRNKNSHPLEIAQTIGASELVYQTIPCAISCFLYSPNSFEETLINAANLIPGDTDSIACIAGTLTGARNGYEAIPEKFKTKLEDISLLEILAEQLFEISQSTNAPAN
ncbi:MAG: ADP-ribosylglycohydrolase family protein [Nanoarchaeota archaeon]|nr:ADP-ribosylglycohydrolase family protein [Nanoarchaeota archaeon]